jgi:hypothetical protein
MSGYQASASGNGQKNVVCVNDPYHTPKQIEKFDYFTVKPPSPILWPSAYNSKLYLPGLYLLPLL